MLRLWTASLLLVFGFNAALSAQDAIQRGRLKKVDAASGTVVIATDGQDESYVVTPQTRLMDANGRAIADGLKSAVFREGAAVMFRLDRRDGRRVLSGIRLVGDGDARPSDRPPAVDTAHFKPLPELGAGAYQGHAGGLYPAGKNSRPEAHEAAGLALARQVRPLDERGQPHPDGKIVLLSIGMSNTSQEFEAFKTMADADPAKGSRVVIVNGAQGGMTAAAIVDPADNGRGARFWTTVDERLRNAGVTREQVQAAWIKQADAAPNQPFPKHAQILQDELTRIVQLLPGRFPNLKLAYLSSRIYAGFATTRLNPEPYAYESGFAVKWLIGRQVEGDAALSCDPAQGPIRSPWLSWGPYLWAPGATEGADGLSYEPDDFAGDGTHPSNSGRRKVARKLLEFFKTDPTTRVWFVGGGRQTNSRARGPARDRLFTVLDRDGDGRLGPQELARAAEWLDVLDRDGDESLDGEELDMVASRGDRAGEIITRAARGERHEDALAVGDEAPDFTLPTPNGKAEVRLSSFRGKKPVVLVFASFT